MIFRYNLILEELLLVHCPNHDTQYNVEMETGAYTCPEYNWKRVIEIFLGISGINFLSFTVFHTICYYICFWNLVHLQGVLISP
jgi:hypothetical protein